MTNRVSSFPAKSNVALLNRHAGRITAYDELAIKPLGNDYVVDGSGTVTRLPIMPKGTLVWLRMAGAPTFVNSAKLICQGGVNYTATVGDLVLARSSGSGIWRIFVLSSSAALIAPNNLSDLPNPAAARTNLGLTAATSVRQAVISGAIDIIGQPAFLSAGAGLNVNLAATASPLYMTFASGYSLATGATDYIGQLAADQASYWASLPASNLSFLAVDRNPSTGALTATQTIVRPQTGPVFDKTQYSLLHMENSTTDDYGNTWSNFGTFSNSIKKFGTYSWQGNGTNAYISSALTTFGTGNWTMEFQVYIPTLANGLPILCGANAAGYGALLQVVGTAPYHFNWLMSSTGNTWDITNQTGATNLTAATWYHVAITFDGTTYRLFLNGTLELSVASSLRVAAPLSAIGFATQFGVGGYGNINIDEVRFSPCARYVANFTAPVAAFSPEGDWFDTNSMVMKTVSGAGPAFTALQRLYVGQAVTDATTVTSAINYRAHTAYQGALIRQDSNVYQVGKQVYYKGGPAFITQANLSTAAAPTAPAVLYVLPPSQVPPDALEFYIQLQFSNGPINGSSYADSSFLIQLPNTSINYAVLANLGGKGFGTGTTPFLEVGGMGTIPIPVLNGVAAFKGINQGNTPLTVTVTLVGYRLP
jgi:hypothetical protein